MTDTGQRPNAKIGPWLGTDDSELAAAQEQWQGQTAHRAECLRSLTDCLSALARRLLAAHREWEVQQCLHLDHASLEVRAHRRAAAVIAECRWAEDLRWQDMGALEISIARLADFRVAGLPELFRDSPDRPSPVMDRVAREVQQEVLAQEVLAQARLVAPGLDDVLQRQREW